MSFDHLSLPSANNNKPPNLSLMDVYNNTPNSLKHPTSPHYQYKYSKNKHLSQQIHKKKKKRNKQNQHKKKKFIKIKHIKHTSKKQSKPKKPKLKKSLSLSSLTQNDDDFTYINKHNEMNQKHKKIQMINNNLPYYYLHTTSTSNKNLNNYNYNNANKSVKPNIIWVQSPSPMLVPTNISTNKSNKQQKQQQCTVSSLSPFLLPVSIPYHRNNCTENTDNSVTQKPKLSQSPFNSPLMESMQSLQSMELTNGELLMGFESGNINANILFHSLPEIGDLLPQRSKGQISVVSDYKYEGLQNYGNTDTVQHSINNCLNTLKSINNFTDSYTSNELSLDKLNEMECIIKELKNKIKSSISNSEEKKCDPDTNANAFMSTDNEQTDSSFLRSHLSVNTNTSSSDEEHEDEDGYEDDDSKNSNQSMIAGVRFIEHPTTNGSQDNVDVVYYD